jgi:hypothetical protein
VESSLIGLTKVKAGLQLFPVLIGGCQFRDFGADRRFSAPQIVLF